MKYLLLVLSLALCLGVVHSQQTLTVTQQILNPQDFMDAPIEKFEPATNNSTNDPVLQVIFHHSFANNLRTSAFGSFVTDLSLFSILDYVAGLSNHFTHDDGQSNFDKINSEEAGNPYHYGYQDIGFLSGAGSSLVNDLNDFVTGNPANAEILTMSLTAGESAFIDDNGDGITPDPNKFYEDLDVQKTENITFYAGRSTSIAGGNSNPGNTEHVATIVTGGTQYELNLYGISTPLILDMDGDKKLEASKGDWLPHRLAKDAKMVAFDINGDGFDEVVEWVGPNDGLLLVYNGQQVTGNDLFGAAGGFDSGYEKLSAHDTDGNGIISGNELDELSVWQDKNGNAKVDSGEISSVTSLGISEIATNHKLWVSSFKQNGETKVMWDWHPTMALGKKRK